MKSFSATIDDDKLYDEYAIFKRQANIEAISNNCLDVLSMINYSDV